MERIEIVKGSGLVRRWYWRVRAANGRIVDTGGEPYVTKWNAKRAARKRYPHLPVAE